MTKLQNAREEVSIHMNRILQCFKPGAKITVLVRNQTHEQDFMMSNDTIDEAIALLERSKAREEIPADK